MIGAVHVVVRNKRNSYDFTLRRNITLLQGGSGTGKTTLYEMIRAYNDSGNDNSGVKITCDKNIVVLEGKSWEEQLEKLRNSIVVIDEGSKFILSSDFASKVKGSDNYFLIITRNYLAQLPYSVDEIYHIKGRGKKKAFERSYKDVDRFYNQPNLEGFPFYPKVIITEDSGSGYQFFAEVAKMAGIRCERAGGKSKIAAVLKKYENDNVIIVADGAALGPEMDNFVKRQKLSHGKLALFFPESFEWLILKSGIVGDPNIEELEHPENYADSKKYISWEPYFTDLLCNRTADYEYMRYKKNHLGSFYIEQKETILKQMPHVNFENQEKR